MVRGSELPDPGGGREDGISGGGPSRPSRAGGLSPADRCAPRRGVSHSASRFWCRATLSRQGLSPCGIPDGGLRRAGAVSPVGRHVPSLAVRLKHPRGHGSSGGSRVRKG